MRARILSAAAIVVAMAFQASADVTYTSQTRTIRAFATSAGAFTDEQTASAPDFGPWNAEVFALSHPEPPQSDSTGHASQLSALTQSGITFSGVAEGFDGYLGGGAGGGSGRSILDVTFDITGPDSTWMLDVRGSVGMVSRIEMTYERISPSPAVLFQGRQFAPDLPWLASGALTAGTYRMFIDVLGAPTGFGTGGAGMNYSMTYTIPAPATGVLGLVGLGAARRRRAK